MIDEMYELIQKSQTVLIVLPGTKLHEKLSLGDSVEIDGSEDFEVIKNRIMDERIQGTFFVAGSFMEMEDKILYLVDADTIES